MNTKRTLIFIFIILLWYVLYYYLFSVKEGLYIDRIDWKTDVLNIHENQNIKNSDNVKKCDWNNPFEQCKIEDEKIIITDIPTK